MQIRPARQSGPRRLLSHLFAKRSKSARLPGRGMLSAIFLTGGLLLVIAAVRAGQASFIPNGMLFPNPDGLSQTDSANGKGIDLTGPFFQSLGTNGRSCGTCHQPSDGMSVSAAHIQQRFVQTQGVDPIFRTVDGSNCNHSIDVSTLDRKSAAYSLLRTRGLIRIGIAVPANADYRIVGVQQSIRMQRERHDFDVPTAAALHQPPLLERGDV